MTELETQEKQNKEILTEVTSIAKEEERTGQKIHVPSPEELVVNASTALMKGRKLVPLIFGKLSKKATLRALNAIFDLPAEGVPVFLKGDDEKAAFRLGQELQMNKFIIFQHHISQEVQRLKKEKENTQVLSNNTDNNKEGVSNE